MNAKIDASIPIKLRRFSHGKQKRQPREQQEEACLCIHTEYNIYLDQYIGRKPAGGAKGAKGAAAGLGEKASPTKPNQQSGS